MSWTNCKDSCQRNLWSAVLYLAIMKFSNGLLLIYWLQESLTTENNGGSRRVACPASFSSFCDFFLPKLGGRPPPSPAPSSRSATGEAVPGILQVKDVSSQRTRCVYPRPPSYYSSVMPLLCDETKTGRLREQDGRRVSRELKLNRVSVICHDPAVRPCGARLSSSSSS